MSEERPESVEFGKRQYTGKERERISDELQEDVEAEDIQTRKGFGTSKLSYIEHHRACEIANRIFGATGWSDTIDQLKIIYINQNNNGRWDVGVYVQMTVMLPNGARHSDIGWGDSANIPHRGDAVEKALKQAASDARKRALRIFGRSCGLSLYDKRFLEDVESNKKQKANAGNGTHNPSQFNMPSSNGRRNGSTKSERSSSSTKTESKDSQGRAASPNQQTQQFARAASPSQQAAQQSASSPQPESSSAHIPHIPPVLASQPPVLPAQNSNHQQLQQQPQQQPQQQNNHQSLLAMPQGTPHQPPRGHRSIPVRDITNAQQPPSGQNWSAQKRPFNMVGGQVDAQRTPQPAHLRKLPNLSAAKLPAQRIGVNPIGAQGAEACGVENENSRKQPSPDYASGKPNASVAAFDDDEDDDLTTAMENFEKSLQPSVNHQLAHRS